MKNFSYVEEQKLIHKIWKLHNKIFGMPAKRFVFCIIDPVMNGTVGYAYDVLKENNFKNIILINLEDLQKFSPQFGDKIVIINCNCDLDIKNDIHLEQNSQGENISIIADINFFYYRQYIQLFRESIENYQSKFEPTQLTAFEEMIK